MQIYSKLTLQEIIDRYDFCAVQASQVPGYVKKEFFGPVEKGSWRDPDIYTPLKEGKGWTYEYTARFQPRTARILLAGGDFMLFWKEDGVFSLIQEINEQIVEIRRRVNGSNPCDPEFSKYSIEPDRFYSLPEPIRMAYYYRFDGLNIPNDAGFGIYTRLLPYPIGRPWQSIDRYLGSLRLKKKYLPLVEEMIPGIKPTDKDMPYVDFMRFLDSRPHGGKEGDVFFVKNHIQDGIIYYIRDGDVPNMSILENPAEAIDLYCEHVLLRKEGRFDFRPWAVPFRPVTL